jgi:glycosyltransferase involved in cell wall biosynthesis
VVNLPDKSKTGFELQVKGGAEFQCYLIAKHLASIGWDVTYIILEPTTIIEKAFRIYCVKGLGRGLLRRYSRAPSLFVFMREINPDIIVTAHRGSLIGFVALYCLLYRKKLLYRARHTFDGDLTFGKNTGWNDLGFIARRLHTFAVKRADAIVANSEDVARVFKRSLPMKKVWVIKNGLPIDAHRGGSKSIVVWIGRFEKQKNPETFIRLAKKLPEIRFVMCGYGQLYEDCVRKAKTVQNLCLNGWADEGTKRKLFDTAYAFVSTSSSEGFPNTLIEAGTYSVPYISFVDPDEVICQNKLGFHVNSFSELVEKTRLLANDSSLRTEMAVNIRHYVEKEHRIEDTVSKYVIVLSSLLDNSRRNPSQES